MHFNWNMQNSETYLKHFNWLNWLQIFPYHKKKKKENKLDEFIIYNFKIWNKIFTHLRVYFISIKTDIHFYDTMQMMKFQNINPIIINYSIMLLQLPEFKINYRTKIHL